MRNKSKSAVARSHHLIPRRLRSRRGHDLGESWTVTMESVFTVVVTKPK